MLITKYIEVKIDTNNKYNKYNKLGYSCKVGDTINVKIEDISKFHKSINVTIACDRCKTQKTITISSCWIRYGEPNKQYICKKCIKNTLNKRKCEICGSTDGVSDYLDRGQLLCNRHKSHIRSYGFIKRTITDCNEIREFNDYAEFDTYSKDGEVNGTFKIDLDMVDFIKKHKCHKHYDGYATLHIKDKNGIDKKVRLHRVVMNMIEDKDEGKIIDHINRDKSDNRKCNLRIVSHETNNRNTGMYCHNTSGVKGISWNKKTSTWEVYIHQHNKKINLGRYKDKNKAINVREIAEIIYFGKDSPRYEELINKYIDSYEIKNYLTLNGGNNIDRK